MSKVLGLLCFLGLLFGCIRPKYEPPYIETPCQWRMPADEGSTLCNLRWWEQFGDPVLNDLIIQSLKYNQDLKVAISRVFEFYARFGIVNSDRYPTVNGNARYTRSRNSTLVGAPTTPVMPLVGAPTTPVMPSAGRILNDYQLFLSLSWELDFWGRLQSLSDAAAAELMAQIEVRRGVVITVVSSVANAYIQLRQFDLQLQISKKTLASRLESLKLALVRFKLGETSELEVKQAEAEVEIAAIRVIEFEREIPIQENLISILVGENPRDIDRGRAIDAFQYPPSIPAGLPSDLLERRPDIVQAEDQLIAANARITAAKALFFPQLSLTGLYGVESNDLATLLTSPARMWRYSVSAVQTIFDAGRTVFGVYQAQAVRDEALHNYYQTILSAFKEVEDALIRNQKNRELVFEHQRQVKVLNEYLNLAQLRYTEGEIDYLNVLDAERSSFEAELQQITSQADSFTAVVQLYRALAGGWVTDADDTALMNTIDCE